MSHGDQSGGVFDQLGTAMRSDLIDASQLFCPISSNDHSNLAYGHYTGLLRHSLKQSIGKHIKGFSSWFLAHLAETPTCNTDCFKIA